MDTKDTTDPMSFLNHENYFTPGPCMWTTLLNHKQKLTEIGDFKVCTTLRMSPVLLISKARTPCASFLMCECACIRVFLFCCCCCPVVLCCCAVVRCSVVPLSGCSILCCCTAVLLFCCSLLFCCAVVLLFCVASKKDPGLRSSCCSYRENCKQNINR